MKPFLRYASALCCLPPLIDRHMKRRERRDGREEVGSNGLRHGRHAR